MSIENDILIVDADMSSLRFLTELLEKEGYHVRATKNFHSAIEATLGAQSLAVVGVRVCHQISRIASITRQDTLPRPNERVKI